MTVADRNDLLALLYHHGQSVSVSGSVHICRDPDDNMVIETAVRGQATMLVTRDEDIYRAPEVLALLTSHGVTVVGLRALLASIAD